MTRVFIPILLASVLMLALDSYAYQAIRVGFRNSIHWVKWFYWGMSILSIAAVLSILIFPIPTWPQALRTYLFSVIMLLIVGKLFIVFFLFLEDISRFFRWGFATATNKTPEERNILRTAFLGKLAIIAGGIPLISGVYGMVQNAYNYQLHRLTVKLPNLPKAFEGLKIVQISDIHAGSFTAKKPIERAIEMINKENADIVFFTGDLVNNRASEFEPYQKTFGKIKAKEGIYSCLGNHDYGDYYRWKSEDEKTENMQLLQKLQKDIGWQILLNENRIIERAGEKIAVLGVENWSAKRFGKRGRLDLAKKGLDNIPVKLLISHDPSHWDAEILPQHKDIDITFSGHTHGAQFGIEWGPIRWSPSQYIYPQWAGLYNKGKQFLYVNRGFGFLGYPGRIGILPEITVLKLSRA